MRFVAFVHKDPDSCFGVSFPDVPGCISAGDTLEEALANGAQALAAHIELTVEYGEPAPVPRPPDAIMSDPDLDEWREGAVLALVPYLPDESDPVRVDLSLDRWLLDAIDESAKAEGLTRSRWLADRARQAILQRA